MCLLRFCFCLESTNPCSASHFVLCFLFGDDVLLHIKPLGQNTTKETNSSPLKELSVVGTCQGSLLVISLLLYGWRDKQARASVGSGFWDVEEGGRLEWQLLSFRLLCYGVVQLRHWPRFSHVSSRWGANFCVIFSLNASGLVPERVESGSGLTYLNFDHPVCFLFCW